MPVSVITKKVLIVTDVDFWALNAGHRMRISSLVSYLSAYTELHIAYAGPIPTYIRAHVKEVYGANLHLLEPTKQLNSTGYGKRLKAFLKCNDFDTIIIEYIHNSYFLNFLDKEYHLVLDTHDIVYERAKEFENFGLANTVFTMKRSDEAAVFNAYDNIMVICRPDFESAAQMTDAGKLLLCPHPVLPVANPVRAVAKHISFIASEYFPNRDAITCFLQQCWPAIRALHPVELFIYGSICGVIDAAGTDGVHLVGHHPSLAHVYQESDIIINPVRFGSGLKIKNIEALANGVPLVTTSHGARGIDNGSNCFLIADEPGEFTKAVCKLVEDQPLRQLMSCNALELIKRDFSAEKCFCPLLQAIEFETSAQL